MHPSYTTKATGHYILKNVRLETGFEYDQQDVIRTKTDLFCIEIDDGNIKTIQTNRPNAEAIDAEGRLLLPACRDMHVHLDKTLYGLPWQAHSPKLKTVKEMIAHEQKIIPMLLKTSTARAEQLIGLLQRYGTTFARTHVNIDPTSGLESLEHLMQALVNKNHTFEAELVAFPQHGLYYTDSAPLMREAAKVKNIGFIGGVDPYTIDGAIEKTIDFTVQLALDNNKGMDIHLHETGSSGLKTVEYLIDKVNENPSLRGKTYISHCFVLGRLEKAKQEEIAAKLGAAQIGIVSTIPFGGLIMPIPILYKHQVNVLTGNDSIVDHWNTFGTGSVLQKANLMAQLYGYSTEFLLSRSLKLATANILPLDDQGVQQWPKIGDEANMVFLNASCSAEAVSRITPVASLIHQGHSIF